MSKSMGFMSVLVFRIRTMLNVTVALAIEQNANL